MTTFNHKAITELANMAALRNHLLVVSQNRHVSSIDEANDLRGLISRLDKEIVRRALGSDMETTTKKKKTTKKSSSKKSSAKKGTAVKRVQDSASA